MNSTIAVANAPCSWGVLEGFDGPLPGYARVLDEMALAGYAGTELGDWGFLPTDAEALRDELARRDLTLVGAFVPVALADASAHDDGEAQALRAARLLAALGAPFLVLADAGDAERARLAGRVRPEHGLSAEQWITFAWGAERIARAVRDATGLRTVFHHHAGTYVEAPAEVETLLELTDPSLLGLCLDTGHYTYGGGDALDALRRYGERVWHVHAKDCDGDVLSRTRRASWDYTEAVRRGVFCELGRGAVDLAGLVQELRARDYRGWVVVEDEAPPGMGTPLESARRDREYLQGLGL